MADPIDHPRHYTEHPSGIECITITEHMNFCLGNAMKYIWRADLKGDAIEDLKKARWYIDRELERRGLSEGNQSEAGVSGEGDYKVSDRDTRERSHELSGCSGDCW